MQIIDGRSRFYQWDMNQQLTCDGLAVGDEVHFANAASTEALVVEAYALEDGTVVANVPNALLREPYPITAYRYIMAGAAEYTREAATFEVQKRPRPSDYIYTETEVYSFEVLSAEMRQALATLDEFNAKQDETLKALAEAKVDKVTSKDLDRVYVATHDGKQGTKPVTTAPSEWTIPQRESGGSVRVGRANRGDAAVPLSQMNEALDDKAGAKEVETLAKKVDNLEAGLAPDMFVVDESSAYVKTIPTDAAPYAEILAVGGMTHKVEQLGEEAPFYSAGLEDEYGVEVYPDGTIYLNYYATNECNRFFDDFFSATVGKKYILRTSAEGGNLQPARIYTGGIPIDTPFVFTEELKYETIVIRIGYDDDGGAGQSCGSTFKLSLREVTDVLLDTPVTALDIVGKNLFDEKAVTHLVDYAEKISIHDPRAEGYLRVPVGTSAAAAIFNPVMYLKEGQTVCISADVYIPSGGAPSLDIYVMIHYLEENPSGSGSINSTGAYKAISAYGTWERLSVTRTAKKSGWFRLGTQAKGASVDLRVKNIKVTTDTTDTTFSPYHKTTFAIPAAVQALDGYGWGVDGAVNGVEWDDNGKPVFVKRVGKAVYNGTESWYRGEYETYTKYECGISDMKSYSTISSNKFANGSPLYTPLPCIAETSWSITCYPANPPDTVEEWKAQLAQWAAEGNPLTVYYELAEPIVTDVSAYFTEDNLIPVEGGGTITAVNAEGLAAPTTIVYQKRGA